MKIMIGGLLATISIGTYSANAQTSIHDGAYMGIEGSYGKTSQSDLTIITPEFDGVVFEGDILSTTTRNPLYTAEGGGAGVFLGYRISEGQFTLAAEANYTYSLFQMNLMQRVDLNKQMNSAFQYFLGFGFHRMSSFLDKLGFHS